MASTTPSPLGFDDINLDEGPQFTGHLPGNFTRAEDIVVPRRTRLMTSLEALLDKPNRWAVIVTYQDKPTNKNKNQAINSARHAAMNIEGRGKTDRSKQYAHLATVAGGRFECAIAMEGNTAAVAARFVVVRES